MNGGFDIYSNKMINSDLRGGPEREPGEKQSSPSFFNEPVNLGSFFKIRYLLKPQSHSVYLLAENGLGALRGLAAMGSFPRF